MSSTAQPLYLPVNQQPIRPRLVNRIQDDPQGSAAAIPTIQQPGIPEDSGIANMPVSADIPPPSTGQVVGTELRRGLSGQTPDDLARVPLKSRILGALAGAGGAFARGAGENVASGGAPQGMTFNGREWVQSPQFEMQREQQMMGHQERMENMRLAEMIKATQMRGQYGEQNANIRGQYGNEQTQMRGDTSTQNVAATQAGATGRTEMTQAGANQRQQNQLTQQLNEFHSTDQYRKWKEQLDTQTKLQVAALHQSMAPATMLNTAMYAQGGIKGLNDATTLMQQLQAKGVMGSLPANWVENWLFGNNMVDPNLDPETRQQIGQLKAALSLGSSAMTKAHTNRTSLEIYNDFKQMLGPGQDWNALTGAIQESQSMLQQYAQAASNQNIMKMRQGQAQQPQRLSNKVQQGQIDFKPNQ